MATNKITDKEEIDLPGSDGEAGKFSRRKFFKGAATIAAVAATVPLEPLLSSKASAALAASGVIKEPTPKAAGGNSNAANRMNDCFNYRKNTALDERLNVGAQADNGDAARFTDFSGCYSKALKHDSLGV